MAFKGFIKPFEAPQKSAKIKIHVDFLFSSGIGTGFECSAYSPPSIVDALKSEKMLNFVDYAKNNVVLC